MKGVSAFDTPFAPLGLAIGWINAWLYTFRLSEALINRKSAPAECHPRIHSVDFGAKGIQKRSIYCASSIGRFGFLTDAEYQTRILPDPTRKQL